MFSQGGGPLQGFCLWNALSTPTSPTLTFFFFFFNLTTISPQPPALMFRPSTSSRSPISLDVGHQLLGDGEQVQALPDVATQAGGEGHSGKGQEAHMPLLWWVGSNFLWIIGTRNAIRRKEIIKTEFINWKGKGSIKRKKHRKCGNFLWFFFHDLIWFNPDGLASNNKAWLILCN